jgi:hypothetical protein
MIRRLKTAKPEEGALATLKIALNGGIQHSLISASYQKGILSRRIKYESSLRALEISITPEILLELDKIFPGTGGAAPEAYTW